MANMSYCKFRNTLEDLKDCIDSINDPSDLEEEEAARKKLIATCRRIAAEAEAEDEGGVKTELSEADIKKYVEDGGCSCPFCGCDDIAGDDVNTGGGEASQEMSCPECGAQWNDCYDLVGIGDHRGPERRQVMAGCGKRYEESVPTKYSCKVIMVTCGSTSPYGDPWLCDKCAALPENRNRDWRREAEEAGEQWDEDY